MSYHPTMGRFLERDPAEYDDTMNLYQDVRSNPTNLTDPSGFGPGPYRPVFHPPLPTGPWTAGDFVHHYLGEFAHAGLAAGTTIDLADVGLLGTFQNAPSVVGRVDEFKAMVNAQAKAKAKTLSCDNPLGSFGIRDRTTTNVVREIFVVGGSTFFREARIDVSVGGCVCCDGRQYPTTYAYDGTVSFSINDAFLDPFDGDRIIGRPLPEYGTPFGITAHWTVGVSGSGQLPTPC